jgi:hypothetical protein
MTDPGQYCIMYKFISHKYIHNNSIPTENSVTVTGIVIKNKAESTLTVKKKIVMGSLHRPIYRNTYYTVAVTY